MLPDAFASDPERLRRFQREAQVLASLNHPNIAHVYGLEQADGAQALVMELVEGPTLADRISQGPVPIDEALPIAKQISEALEAAHEQGIIHRDLKPANIKLRQDGTVKVLDFGLAKALEPVAARGTDATASPTITSPAMTGMGVLLGTAAYMAPEQVRGKPVDKRAHIWAFGVVLYEMLSGQRTFKGDDISDTLAAVLRQDIDWTALPASTPASVRRLIARCLDRDAKGRLRDIGEARIVLDDPAALARGDSGGVTAHARSRPLWRRATPIAAALLVGAVLAAGSVWLMTRPAPPSVVRTTITTSGSTAANFVGVDQNIAITPDGSRLVYRGNNQLLVRGLNQIEPEVLGGLGAARNPFISPDGQWIGFYDADTIKKVAITGGPPVTIARADGVPRGATWGPDGTIVIATGTVATGLQRVSADGGEPMVLTKPDRERGEGDHRWPEFLPGGRNVLFTINPPTGGGVDIASVDRQGRVSPLPGVPPAAYRDVRVSPDGARLALAIPLEVWTYEFARATLSRLTTDPGEDRSPLWTPDGQRIVFTSRRAGYWELFWRPADGTGSDERLLRPATEVVDLHADGWSADGRHALFTEVLRGSPNNQCAVGQLPIERSSDVRVLVTSDFCNQFSAISPNGRWMAYQSNVSGREEIYVERYPELGSRQQISTAGGVLPLWSRDGRELFFSGLDGRQMFVVPARSGTTLVAGRPQVLFEAAMLPSRIGQRPYEVAPNGRFIVIRPADEETENRTAPSLILVQNWTEELKRLVPTN